MSATTSYRRFPTDFVHGVIGLGAAEIGAYAIILDLIYDRGGPIPNDSKWIGGILGEHSRRARTLIDHLVACGKLFEVEGKLHNKRAERELKGEQKAGETRSENASFAATSRWHGKENQALSDAPRKKPPPPARASTTTKEKKDSSSTLEPVIPKEEKLDLQAGGGATDDLPGPLYSEKEIRELMLTFDFVDVRKAIPELEAWCEREVILGPERRRNAIYGALKKRQEVGARQAAIASALPAQPSEALLRSKLVVGGKR